MKRVCIIMACHNRRLSTLRSLSAIFSQKLDSSSELDVLLLDDSSPDGTSEAVAEQFPTVKLIVGTGSMYWNGGMRKAFEVAMESDYDYYMWLNDDTYLYSNSVSKLLTTHEYKSSSCNVPVMVVGTTYDWEKKRISYGGWRCVSKWNSLKMERVIPGDEPAECDTMNGNCVFLSRSIVKCVGNLDEAFSHSMGDIDYGFRARNKGCEIWVASGLLGDCQINSSSGAWTDNSLVWKERVVYMLGPKGLPLREWYVFTRRHGGWLWLFYCLNPYLKLLWDGLCRVNGYK